MEKINFKYFFFTNLFIIHIFLSISPAFSAVLRWSPVGSTNDCTIAGYKVHYGITSGDFTDVVDVNGQDNNSYDLDNLNLLVGQTYFFAVSAYSTTNQEGPLSSSIYHTRYPFVDYANNTIDLTFGVNIVQGAYVTSNYEFIPTILFDDALAIIRTGWTYHLFLKDIPPQIIFSMGVSNVLDSDGNPLISDFITINDNDNNNMPDDWEEYYGINSAFLDADSDGLDNRSEFEWNTNPLDSDSDNDGMDDGWEVKNGLNPVADDADGDIDGDGIGNLEEYNQGSGVSNRCPEKPLLNLPVDFAADVELNPQLITGSYVDRENDSHEQTNWQISTQETFTENILFERDTYNNTQLTTLIVPEFILETGKTYFWRVKFFDELRGVGGSLWSEPFSFTTIVNNPEDSDQNGVPDIQQVMDGTIDLNNDGNNDVSTDTYKIATSETTTFALEASNGVTAIDCLKFIDSDDIIDTRGKPDLDFGLMQFKLRVNSPGDTAKIKIYFSEPVGDHWYKYDIIDGWTEYSSDYPDNVDFSSDRRSVILTLIDGGPGDSDGVANGIIVDPSGPGGSGPEGYSPPSSNSGGGSGGGGGGGCFIATAAFGSPIDKHVQILKDFRDIYLLKSKLGVAFVKTYYKYSPPIANVIERNGILKNVVRIGLMPIILFGYIAIHASLIQQVLIFLFIIGAILYLNFKFQISKLTTD